MAGSLDVKHGTTHKAGEPHHDTIQGTFKPNGLLTIHARICFDEVFDKLSRRTT